MKQRLSIPTLACVVGFLFTLQAQAPSLLGRRYVEGERLQYLMKGQNDGSTFEVRITGIVKKGADDLFFEECSFSDFVSNGKPGALSPTDEVLWVAITLQKGTPLPHPLTFREKLKLRRIE